MGRLATWKQGLRQALQWPSLCTVCGQWPAQPVCAACRQRFLPRHSRCARCAAPVDGASPCPCHAQGGEPALDACVAAVDYAFPWDRLITRFKFHGEPGWARPFAGLMRDAPGALALLDAADGIVPVPLTPARLAERGHHPPWALAWALARRHPRPLFADALARLSDSPAQHRLTRPQRLRNLRGAFAVPADWLPRLRGARVLLVDDVTTTGATLDACAQALRAGGASQVSALVFARTPAPHERAD